MAAATYSTDLVTVSTADTNLTPVAWIEPTGSTAGATDDTEIDYFIQGTGCVSKAFNATGIGGVGFQNGSPITVPTDGAVFVWVYFAAPNAINTKASGGQQILIGSSDGNYKRYYVAGSDTYTYGGWFCYPINPTITQSATQGSPTTTVQFFGYACNVTNPIARGNPLGCDAVRYGRGTLQVINGDATGYGNFYAASFFNDRNNTTANSLHTLIDSGYHRLGLVQSVDQSFKYQGHLLMGTATTPVDFRDENRNLTIQRTEFVTPNFNLFEVRNASSRVDWTGININSLSTVSKGRFVATDDATINILNCSFTDMDTFIFKPKTVVETATFRRCNTVFQSSCTINDCVFDDPSGSTAILSDSPADVAKITNTTFTSDGTGHAIEIQGTAASTTLDAVFFNNYASTNGSTGNEAVFVNIPTGSMTINIINGGSTPSIRTAGATVTVSNSKSFRITNIEANTEIRIYRQSDMVELGGADIVGPTPSGVNNVTVDSDPADATKYRVSYSYNYTVDTPIYVVAHSLQFQWLRTNFTLTSENSSLQIAQIRDRQYQNI